MNEGDYLMPYLVGGEPFYQTALPKKFLTFIRMGHQIIIPCDRPQDGDLVEVFTEEAGIGELLPVSWRGT